MLYPPTVGKLHGLRLFGMAKALEEQGQHEQYTTLNFEDRLGFMVDRELTERENQQLQSRLRKAKLRLTAAVEDIDFRHPRGLDKPLLMALASCQWIKEHQNCLITGPTGVGKSYIACALAHKACREGYKTAYLRASRMFDDLAIANADGRYHKLLAGYGRLDLLVIDDWGLAPLTDEQRRDLLEIIDERHERRSTLLTSQMPVSKWHTTIGDPTIADAILDRLVHSAHHLALKGDSLRKKGKKT